MATVFIEKRKRTGGYTSYVVTYRCPLSGKNKYYKTFRKLAEATKSRNDLIILLDSGRLPAQKLKFRPMKFVHVAESLKAEWTERLELRELAEKTVEDYIIWTNVVTREFGEKLISEISRDEIIAYRNHRAKERSNVTANKELIVVRMVMQHALGIQALVE